MSAFGPELVRAAGGASRVDVLRKGLRGEAWDAATQRARLEEWLALYHEDARPELRVLLLELLGRIEDPRCEPIARLALEDPADAVRYEGLQLLLRLRPEEASGETRRHLDDDGIEVRLLAAERLFPHDPEPARKSLLDLVETESLGPREQHALDRVTAFLVDEVGDRESLPRLRELRDACDDEEGFLDWAIRKLESSS